MIILPAIDIKSGKCVRLFKGDFEKVTEYKKGKKGLIGLFMGEVMKLSKGKADPKLANQLLIKELKK